MKDKVRVLIVDDELSIRRILEAAFDKHGWHALTAENGEKALEIMSNEEVNCVLTDVTMPGMSGYELQVAIHDRYPEVPVVIMTAFGTIPQAVQSIRRGAFEYITKPFDLEALKKVMQAAVDSQDESKPTKQGKKGARKPKQSFIAESPSMREVLETAEQVADSRATVLITGESGTGKEVVSKLIHEMSPRADRKFVAISCAALPETLLESELFGYEKGAFTGAQGAKPGRFELADGGTLLLDEVGEIPLTIQVKLLRVLQEREFERLGSTKPTKVDVRLITATNRDLQEAVDAGIFRLDLMYRLQVVELHLPALRERVEDIKPLAEHFLARSSDENGRAMRVVGDAALSVMAAYQWPGNVRELENAMERAVVLAGKEEVELLPKHLPKNLTRAA